MLQQFRFLFVNATNTQRELFESISNNRSTVKDTVTGQTSIASISCTGKLIYYGYTGFSATTSTGSTCTTVRAKVNVYSGGTWVEVDDDVQSNTTYADAAGQYGTGAEPSQGYHYVKDPYGGIWYDYTSFSY